MPRAPAVGDRFRVPRSRFSGWLRDRPEEEPANGRDYPAMLVEILERTLNKYQIKLDVDGTIIPASKTEISRWALDFDDERGDPSDGPAQLCLGASG